MCDLAHGGSVSSALYDAVVCLLAVVELGIQDTYGLECVQACTTGLERAAIRTLCTKTFWGVYSGSVLSWFVCGGGALRMLVGEQWVCMQLVMCVYTLHTLTSQAKPPT
jgi:hypothetical protein